MANTIAVPTRQTTVGLTHYYFLRAAIVAVWVAAAFTIGAANPAIAGILLVLYPSWDAVANARDAHANGSFRANASQTVNMIISAIVALAVAVALQVDMHLVLGTFGGWAILSGVLQLITGVRRWRLYGAQWAMILSGAQSALAGVFFIKQSTGAALPSITTIAPYAAFGAFYFLISAIALILKTAKHKEKPRQWLDGALQTYGCRDASLP